MRSFLPLVLASAFVLAGCGSDHLVVIGSSEDGAGGSAGGGSGTAGRGGGTAGGSGNGATPPVRTPGAIGSPDEPTAPELPAGPVSGACSTARFSERAENVGLSADGREAYVPAGVDSVNDSARVRLGRGEGRYYFEVKVLAAVEASYNAVGIAPATLMLETGPGGEQGVGYDRRGLVEFLDLGFGPRKAEPYGVGDVVGVVVDLDRAMVRFTKNGTLQNLKMPGGEVPFLGKKGTPFYPTVTLSRGDRYRINLGTEPFANAPPEGFAPWADGCPTAR
ncbi:MAG: SPRY domain-containing protein [Polyangiaceae bacterium]